MPFRLKNAPAQFQRAMEIALTGMNGIETLVYIDDIVVYACLLQDHARKLFKLLKHANLRLQPDKCEFLRHEVCYLGHIISDKGVRPNPATIETIKRFSIF